MNGRGEISEPAVSPTVRPAETALAQEERLSNTEHIRVGVIGYGYWGPQLVRNMARQTNTSVTCIAELSEPRRSVASLEYPHIRAIDSLDEMLSSEVNAVVIATPVRTHFRLARAALLRGKHVFVEKPLASSVNEARELIRLAREQGRVLMTGHTFLYNPAVRELRSLVETGTLGEIFYADAVRANLGLMQRDINVMWDLAPHDLSILEYVLGQRPSQVAAHGGSFVGSSFAEVVYVSLQYSSGRLAHLHLSWLSPSKVRRFTLVGSQRMVVYDDVETTEKIRIFDRGVDVPDYTSTFGEFQLSYRYGNIVSPHIKWTEPLILECRDFIEAIHEGRPPLSDGTSGLRVVQILEAAEASLANGGRFIDIDDSDA